jgi:hypothetical protein
MANTPNTLEGIARRLSRTDDESERTRLLVAAAKKLRDLGCADAKSVELPNRPSACDFVLTD